mmetsp:Transcript_2875/g.4634  ORF Transcript_2875/g.4634 Transcript_2875/m.4634 type:complete len:175 (+) Transcript_2875:166-690(+)
MELAALNDDRLQSSPVTCITFAAPRVGNLAFAKAFQYLERNRKVRCLRVANDKDIFPTIPKTGTKNMCGITLFGDFLYRHVGILLTLKKDGTYTITYPQHYRHPLQLLLRDWTGRANSRKESMLRLICQENLAQSHSCQEYWTRLNWCSEELKEMDLHEQYKKVAGRYFHNFDT